MDKMSKVESKPTGPKFPGYWKGTDSAAKAKDKMVGGCEESIIKDLHKTAKEKAAEWRLEEAYKNFNEADAAWQSWYDQNKDIIGDNPNLIKPGQDLKMPDDDEGAKYTVQKGDTLSGIAKKFAPVNTPAAPTSTATGTGWKDIHSLNTDQIKDPNKIYPGQKLKLPNGQEYEVFKGDTLSGIAKRYSSGEFDSGEDNTPAPTLPVKPAPVQTKPEPVKPAPIDLNPGSKDTAPNKSPYSGINPQLQPDPDPIPAKPVTKTPVKPKLPPAPQPGTQSESIEQKFARLMQEQEEAKYGDKYQAMVQRVGQKAREQEKRKPVDIQALARKLQAADKKLQQVKEFTNKRVAEAGESGAQDPNAQATSPTQQTTSVGSTGIDPAAQKAMKDQQVDIATAKGTVSGLKDLLGPQVDTNAAATGIAKANDNKPLNKQEQQSVAGLTPLMMKAAETPAVAQQLKTALSTAGMLSKLGK